MEKYHDLQQMQQNQVKPNDLSFILINFNILPSACFLWKNINSIAYSLQILGNKKSSKRV